MRKNRAEMIGRLKEAAGYQRKAVLALFSERTRKHLEVIGTEIGSMAAECAEACLHREKPEGTEANESRSKRVEIQ